MKERRCPECGGVTLYWESGHRYVAFCPCQLRQFKASRLGKRFACVRLEDIAPRTARQAEIKNILLKNPMGNYFLWGDANTGKTHFLAALYNYAVDHDYLYESRYFTDRELKRDLTDFEMDRLGDKIPVFTIDHLKEGVVSQIFWDDIGKIKMSEFITQEIFAIVDEIFRRDLRLVATSNFSLDELSDILGNAIVRRINDICKVIRF